MNMIRLALAATLIGLSALATPSFAGKRDNSIRFATDYVLANVDNYFNQDPVGGIFADQVWDTLIYLDPSTGDFKGQLATAWKWIDDRTIEFELRQGVKFHNGAAFDADAGSPSFSGADDYISGLLCWNDPTNDGDRFGCAPCGYSVNTLLRCTGDGRNGSRATDREPRWDVRIPLDRVGAGWPRGGGPATVLRSPRRQWRAKWSGR